MSESSESYVERFRRQMDLMQFETLPLFSRPLFSWNLHTDYVGRRLIYRPSTESTMDDARRALQRWRVTSGAVFLAESQTAGRGRAGRHWVSPPDVNLYFTLMLYPLPAGLQPLAHVTPLAAAEAIEAVAARRGASLKADLKWPNDVLLDGRKVAGVLVEGATGPEGQEAALAGVGVNVNLESRDYPEIAGIATSVREALGFNVERELVLAAFCDRFEALYEAAAAGSRAPFEAWRRRLVTLGRDVVASGGGRELRGRAVDVTGDGALVIQTPDGRRTTVEAGDVTISGP